jgi:small subunit ribosomal protein S17
MSQEPNVRRTLQGVVVGDKMDKTVVIKIERLTRHPLYAKVMKRARTFKAHDEKNECHVGDVVTITECRPISKDKSWRVVGIVARQK